MDTDERSDRRRLIENIIASDLKYHMENSTTTTKERILKDSILQSLKKLVEALNLEYKDVHFQGNWFKGNGCWRETDQGRPLCSDVYDLDFSDDRDDFNDLYNNDDYDDADLFYRTDFQDLGFKLEYFWERRCDIGCQHRTKRFMMISIPKLVEMISFWRLDPPVALFVKQYIPDFFYEPVIKPIVPEEL